MKQSPFGRRLSSQIIWPLVLVSVLVGIVATVVSARVLSDFTRSCGEQGARTTVDYVISSLEQRASSSVQALEVLAARPGFVGVVSRDDPAEIERHLRFASEATDVDMVVVVDGAGTLVAAVPGASSIRDVALPTRAEWEAAFAAGGPVVIPFGDGYALWSQVDIPVDGPRSLALGSVLEVDDDLVSSLAVGERTGVLITDSRGGPLAFLSPDRGAATGALDLLADSDLMVVLDELVADPSTSVLYQSTTSYYRIVADAVPIATVPGEYLLVSCGVDAASAREATVAMIHFVASWSVLAIIVLIVLNWWVVRSVTTPLDALTATTHRLAEGDFTARVDITGPVEITELAENFNRMTDSLSERSESLTKKVLELATLYEMSRSLGLTMDLSTLLHSALDSALRIFEVEIGYIIMYDRESGVFTVDAARGVDSGQPGTITSNSMSEWVIREGRPLIFNPSGVDTDGHQLESFSDAHAALCVPLQTPDGPVGSVTIGSRDPGRRFTSDDVRLLATIANQVTIAIGNIGLLSSVQEAYLATVRALAAAVDAKDPYTRGHSEGVAAYALMIGEQLDLSAEQMTALEMAAYLHDIGKIGISEDILLKPGKLTEGEMGQMRHHPLIGANILKPVAFPWPIAPVVRHHHEHYDGGGYPAGLRSDEIPVLARVLTVADAFEAMVADRPYRRSRSHQEAILELERCAGGQFDPRIVEAFVEALEARQGTPQDPSGQEVLIGNDEAQAVFIAITDGLFSNFRRLGGPRLASNLERAVHTDFVDRGMPLTFERGRLVLRSDAEIHDDEYARYLKEALHIVRTRIEEASGPALAEHFLGEALEALPERMRANAERLGLSPTA